MAEQEITYIPYGLDEISLLDLMTSLANGVDSYLNSRNWGKKAKYRDAWLKAYQDIMAQGITGASNDTGIWRINHNGPNIDLSNKSNIEREMYGDAAYYILQQMSQMTPRIKKEEKKDESSKTKFDNAAFNSGLTAHIGSSLYGGMSSDKWNKLWADLDPEDRGIRGTAGRQKEMSNQLLNYLNKIESEKDKYSFEDTPYGSFDEWKNRATRAIAALNNPEWNDDDKNALNALGIDYNEWFNTGADKMVTVNMGDGTQKQMTQAEYNALEDKQKADELAAEQLAKNIKLHLENDGVLSTSTGNKAIDAVYNIEGYNKWLSQTYGSGQEGFNNINSRVLLLLEKSYNQGKANGLNQAERKELGNLLHYIRTNNPKYLNYNLTPEEEGELGKHNSMKGRKLLDFIRLPWQTSDGRYTYADKSGNIYFLKPQNKKLLLQQPFTKSLAYNDYVKNFGKSLLQINNEQAAINMNTPLSLMTEWTPEMKKEIEAIAWDAASILNPEAFSGSAMALNAARLRGEANPNRSTLEKVLDYGTAGLGGIQGFGDLLVTGKLGYRLYQLGKSIGSVSKFAGILGAGFGAIGAYEARDSIAKLATDRDSLTPQDLENIAYGLMGLIGLKSFAKARNKQTIGKQTNPTVTEHNITVKDKNGTHEIKIDETTAKDILLLRTLGKKKATVDSEILNMPKIRESIEKYKESNPTKKLEIEGASIVNNSKVGRNKIVTSKQVKNPEAPKYAPVGTKWYRPFGYMAQGDNKWGYYLGGGWQRKAWENAAPEQSSKGLWQRTKEFWNPEPRPILSETSKVTEIPKTESKKSNLNTELYNKNSLYEYNILNTPNRNNSKLLLKGDSLSALLADGNTYRFVYSHEGEAIVMLNGKPVVNPVKVKNLNEAKEIFSNFVKEVNSKTQNLNLNLFIRRFESKYLENIRELKRKGFFLKQGGTINNNDLDTIINDFLKNNNI